MGTTAKFNPREIFKLLFFTFPEGGLHEKKITSSNTLYTSTINKKKSNIS